MRRNFARFALLSEYAEQCHDFPSGRTVKNRENNKMRDISVTELYELYLDTIARCTSELKSRSNEEIQHDLFEEFDVGAHTFLHEENLDKLRRAGYIDDEMLEISKQVREQWLALQNKSWTIEEIRIKKEWREIFDLCDRLKLKANLLRAK